MAQEKLKWLLLDGQQRTTTIYNAFENGFPGSRGGSKDVVLDVKAALQNGEVTEAELEIVPGGQIGAYAEMAQRGKISLRTALQEGQFEAWRFTYAEKHLGPGAATISQLVDQLDAAIPGLRSLSKYSFPVLEIKEQTPLDVVVDIFEGMNRRGQRLNQFDLMVARLYRALPDGSRYDLRQAWATALETSDHLLQLGVTEEDGMLPLQLIAMQVSRLPAAARMSGIKGLSNRDVLELPYAQVIGHSSMKPPLPNVNLETATKALDAAAEFLMSKCGVACAQLLPQQSMLIPLADQFLQPDSERLSAQQMKRWFFAAGLSVSYYGSVNSYAYSDCKALNAWALNGDSSKPTSVRDLDRAAVNKLDLVQDMTREGQILGASLMALLVSSGVKDWRSGMIQLSSVNEDVQLHHVVPHLTLKKMGVTKGSLKPIAGLTPISASANRSFRDKNPGQVCQDLGAESAAIVLSHHIDEQLLVAAPKSKSAWEMFVKDRQARLRAFIIAELGL